MRLSRGRIDARLRRQRLLLTYFYILLALFAISVLAAGFFAKRSGYGIGERAAAIGDVLGAGTLLLALLAALIALQAYAAATGLPDLRVQVWFDYSDKNCPVFRASKSSDGRLQSDLPIGQTIARISVSNSSGYSARNPAVVLRFRAMSCELSVEEMGWSVIDTDARGRATVVQWDGGGTYSIHGRSTRRLPAVDLGRVLHNPEQGLASIAVEMLAEGGYRREALVPVRFINGGNSALAQKAEVTRVADWL